ncbi:NRPS-like enzyme [Penicillium lividum]|nr:NRPS-like enzyme [Penicillium lividum]
MATQDTSFDPRNQLIPNLVNHYAETKPDAIYAEYPVNPMTYDDGYKAITYKVFANTIDGIAHWLTQTLGPGNGEILAYLGPNDLRYPALVLGAVKAGYLIFLTSPRNSPAAHKSLLEKLSCVTLLAPVPRPPSFAGIVGANQLNVVDVPGLEELLTTDYPPFEYSKTYPEAASDRVVVLHTSGSTGIPKPVFWTHGTVVRHMRMQRLEPPPGYQSQHQKGVGKRMYLTLPPFHAAGIGYILFIAMPVEVTLIMPIAAGLPSALGLVTARKQTPFEWAVVPPSILQELAQDSMALDYCSTHLEYVNYCGGDLPQAIGNKVAAKLPVMNGYGASEIGMISLIHSAARDPLTDWRYLQFHPDLGMEHHHVSGEEFEAVIVRSPEREGHQMQFTLFPDLQEYHTRDLMTPHPTKPGLWCPSSRLDDVIVFLNGEKTNPVSMEQHIVAANPEITGCLVAGAQRFQAALLVDLGDKTLNMSDRAAMIEKIWPSIEEANSSTPAHARITKSHILFTSSNKPMVRTAKGTVQRSGSLALYTDELEILYANVDRLTQVDMSQLAGPGGVDDATKVAEYIRESILGITGWKDNVSDEENWFHLGFDSLQVITATRVLRQGLHLPTLSPNVIYLHPTIAGLTRALQNLHQDIVKSTEAKNQALIHERDELLQELVRQMKLPLNQRSEAPDIQTVILTGSTGQLGTYLLDTLLKNPAVGHVYCLSRDDRAHDRQKEHRTTYGLGPVDEARVTFWKADLTEADLGLRPTQFKQLQHAATLIIHNAWTVNFNLSLAYFKPHLTGMINLINFTGQAPYAPHLFFISSISSTMGHHTETGLTPETVITTKVPAPNGYATSKYIGEHLLRYAGQQGFNSAFARVGQIAGPIRSRGLWNKSEWFPSLVLSSIYLNALPETLGTLGRVDWVPIDLLAEILVDLALIRNTGVSVYHPVNLHPLSWKEIRPAIATTLQGLERTVETIPAQEWILRIHRDIELAGNKGAEGLWIGLKKNPAAKLLGFFEEVMGQAEARNVLDVRGTGLVSEKLREVDAVKSEWIEKWVQEWINS